MYESNGKKHLTRTRKNILLKMSLPELFWYWVKERYNIYCNKEIAALEPPWTLDPILQQYRFTNVFREYDRVTKWIKQNIRDPYANHPNLWFMLCIARIFNWPPMLQEISENSFWPLSFWSPKPVRNVLINRKHRGDKVFTGAYLVGTYPIAPYTERSLYIVDKVLTPLWRDHKCINNYLASIPPRKRTLHAMHTLLSSYFGIGDFLAYQIVIDLRHTPVLNQAADINTWVAFGPGSIRGLNRYFSITIRKKNRVEKCIEIFEDQYNYCTKTMPIIELSDIQNCLCEFDKYSRTLYDEGKPRNKYVIGRGY